MHLQDSGVSRTFDSYRLVIETIADLVCCQGFNPEERTAIRAELFARGFELSDIKDAEDWCDQASTSGRLIEVLSTFSPSAEGTRIDSPLEKLFVSDRIWKTIEDCRNRGIFSQDMTERLLEGVRAMDTRDWDDEELRLFIEDACSNPEVTGGTDKRLRKALNGDFGDYYS